MRFLFITDQPQFGLALTFPHVSRVLIALLLSLSMHASLFFAWNHLQTVSDMPIVVHGELLPPVMMEPPPRIEPLPSPPPVEPEPLAPVRKLESPLPKHEAPEQKRKQVATSAPKQKSNSASKPVANSASKQTPKQAPDTGVALPLLAEKVGAATGDANDYVVPEVQPLAPGDKLPFASRPGETPLGQYIPSKASSSESNEAATTADSLESKGNTLDRGALAEYGRELGKRAQQLSIYPTLALYRGWEGRVGVLVKYNRNGVAYQISVKDSSGQPILDNQALEMVKKACADFALPTKLVGKAFSVVLPIDFILKK